MQRVLCAGGQGLNLYEGMFLLDPGEASKNFDDAEAHVRGLIEGVGGRLLYSEKWAARKLAYEIQGRRRGVYHLTFFECEGEAIPDLRGQAKLSDRILRLLLLRNDDVLQEIEGIKSAKTESPAEQEGEGLPGKQEVHEEQESVEKEEGGQGQESVPQTGEDITEPGTRQPDE